VAVWLDSTTARTPWHALAAEDVLRAFESAPTGLSDAEAEARLAQVGPNRLQPPRPASAWSILVAQLKSVIVVLLAAAIGISLLAEDHVEAFAIGAVLVINTVLGFVTELRARRAIEALTELDAPRATVVRDGRLRHVDARELVPGDIVQIDAGRQIPADGRLLEVADLRVDEAPLTGESLPISKSPESLAADTPLAERACLLFKGTIPSAGSARALVTATGGRTEVGRIGALVGAVRVEPTPLERKLDALGRRLVWLALGVAALIALIGWMQGHELGLVLETSLALAVAAVPEALPVVATIALAVGVHRMARRHALVRRLPAVEALGSTTVVCTDKTRTLTSGEMAVVRVWAAGRDMPFPSGEAPVPPDVRRLLEGGARASLPQAESPGAHGDPVDAAFLHAAGSIGRDGARSIDPAGRTGVLPFTSARKRLALFYPAPQGSTGVEVAVKGAPRAVLEICTRARIDEGDEAIDERLDRDLHAVNDAFAAAGLRVLAVAEGTVAAGNEESLGGLTFLGFVGLADPPAPGVPETVARLRRAGLRTIMLTGDQRLTAEAIGRLVGVLDEGGRAMDGRELDRQPPDRIDDIVASTGAFTRITPEHKLTIVQALQRRREIVAMLGDGINDAAALKQADVGVAMGVRGTDVAKQAASIVLQDDRFETIAAAVEEGRVIFDNIRKFVFYLFSCNVAEILVLLVASLAGLPLPLTPLQLLWLNLLTDTFPALALSVEPAAPDVMARPPRAPEEALLSTNFMGRIFFYACLITGATLAAFTWALAHAPDQAVTMAFTTLAFAQVVHLGNARTHQSLLRPSRALSNPFAIAGAGLALVLQLLVFLLPPLAGVLGVVGLAPDSWAVVVACAVVPGLVGELAKWRARRRTAPSEAAHPAAT
jgi:Ca2+-transporting ATPase